MLIYFNFCQIIRYCSGNWCFRFLTFFIFPADPASGFQPIRIKKSLQTQQLTGLKLKIFRGIAGNRTRVQTSNKRAFYTLSFHFGFRHDARPKTATSRLSSLILTSSRSKSLSRFIFTVPPDGPPQTKAFRENPAFLSDRSVALSYCDSD